MMSIDDKIYIPILISYPETEFGGVFDTEANYKDTFMSRVYNENENWVIFPINPHSYNSINLDNAIKKFAVANQIDTQGLIKTEEQIQQEQQQAQQQQFAQQSLADPRVAIEMGKQLANSNVSPSVDGEGNVQLNQGE